MDMHHIGRYTIIEEIGRGAMGVVYRAQDPAIGRTVAIKTIQLSNFADAEERSRLHDRLFREAQSAGILSHPNIVTIYDIAEQDDLAYIAMEYVDGPTLDRMAAAGPPGGQLVLNILAQTAAALDYAHKRGIVHRDIKPANIIIHNREVAKIADFGVAKIQSHEMTHAGALIGTPNYMSPEQIQAREVDGKSDQFSLAVIAYELLTGEKPFTGDSIASLVFKIVKETPVPAHHLNPTLGWPVDSVLQRALAKDPQDRFPTCSDFAFALENACRSSKGWQPLAAGSGQNMATVVDLAPARSVPEPVRTMPFQPPKRTEAEPFSDDTPTAPLYAIDHRARREADTAKEVEQAEPPARGSIPKWLRALRIAAAVVTGSMLLAAAVIAGLQYFRNSSEPELGVAPPESGSTTVSAPPQETATSPAVEPKQEPPQPAPPRPPGAGNQTVRPSASPVPANFRTNPSGASLVVDGRPELSCVSPCTLTLPPGRHTVVATLQGYRTMSRPLDLPGDDRVMIPMQQAAGTLMVRSEPHGASVYVDGQRRPEKTPAMITVPAGRHTVEVENEGRRESQEVLVKDATISNIGVTFTTR